MTRTPFSSRKDAALGYGAGIVAAISVAILARATSLVTGAVPEAPVAVLLGIVVAYVVPPPSWLVPGVEWAGQRLLRVGIVLLGAQLSIGAILAVGTSALVLLLATVSTALLLGLILSRVLAIEGRAGVLIAVGTAICGNTAIMTIGPLLQARERELSYAVLSITLLGTASVLLFPIIGLALGLSPAAFGVWAGAAVHDTSQVVAAAAAYGPESLRVAAVVKLIRNTLIAPLAVGLAIIAGRTPGRAGVLRAFPLFVIGFVVMAALRSLQLLPDGLVDLSTGVARALILTALAAVGLGTPIRGVLSLGVRPLLVAGTIAAAVAAIALFMAPHIAEGAAE